MMEFEDTTAFDEPGLDEAYGEGLAPDPYQELAPLTEAPEPVRTADGEAPQYDPSIATPVAGDPAADQALWHEQEPGANTCNVVAEEFVIEGLTGEEMSEQELAQIA